MVRSFLENVYNTPLHVLDDFLKVQIILRRVLVESFDYSHFLLYDYLLL